jgi:hypothetical protein
VKRRSGRSKKNYPELWLPVPLEVCMKTYCWFNRNRLLSHLRRGFCALAIVGASLMLPSAEAGPPGPASGGFNPCFVITNVQQAGPNTIITFNVTVTATGTLTGSLTGTELDVVHPDGSITLHGTSLMTGSINGGRSGTLLFTYTGIGNINTGHESLRWVGRQGTDGLAGVHAEGTIEGDLVPASGDCNVAGAGTYNGQILFAP